VVAARRHHVSMIKRDIAALKAAYRS